MFEILVRFWTKSDRAIRKWTKTAFVTSQLKLWQDGEEEYLSCKSCDFDNRDSVGYAIRYGPYYTLDVQLSCPLTYRL